MPPQKPPIPDETPTQPDLAAVACPACRGAGGFLEGRMGKGQLVHRKCTWCGGRRTVSRELYAEWHARGKPAG